MSRCAALALCLTLAPGCGKGVVSGPGDGDAPDAGPPAPRCAPTGGDPHWLTEGDTVSVDVRCQTGLDLGPGGFTLTPLPDGAIYDAAARRLTWTPGLDQAAVYHVTIEAPALGEQGQLVIGVADAWDAQGNLPVVDPTAYTAEYGVPVLFLSPAPTADDPYVPVTVTYGGRTYAAEGKLRGATSLAYPKQSLLLKFDSDRFSDPDHAGGFMQKKRIALTTTFDDNSYLRQRLAYQLWTRLEPTVPMQAYNVVLYLDGEYFGLYTATDHIDGDLMHAAGLAEDANLYKAISHDANFRLTNKDGDAKATLHDGYEKKQGTPAAGQPGAFDDLDDLVNFVATSDDASFEADIGRRIDLGDYQKWWMLVTFLQADDTAGKNSYHYHDAVRTWRVVPWDFNDSLGQTWTTTREAPSPVDDYTQRNRLFERLLASPTHGPAMRERYRAALAPGGPLDPAAVQALIQDDAAEIAAAAARDWRKWQADYQSFSRWSSRTDWTSPAEETAYLRDWVTRRVAALEDQLGP